MSSLKDVYQRILEHEKTAAEERPHPPAGADEQTKLAMQQAYEWDSTGRQLARHVFYDLQKQAAEHLPVGHGPGHRHEDGLPCAPHCEHHQRGAAHTEKRATLQRAIFDRMQRDPAYVAELVARHAAR